jgi:D-sedoheptulose 7-phosphate isomerase
VLEKFIQNRIDEARSVFSDESSLQFKKLEGLATQIHAVFESGKRVAFVGNGGSAAEAMHLAAEFTGKCVLEHKPLPALCLNESQSALTAIANDFGADFMFSRQVQAHLQHGDLLIAMSTSGKSKNILNALNAANEIGVRTILWMGEFDIDLTGIEIWKVHSTSTPRIQEIHLAWGHIVAEAVEQLMQPTELLP